MTKQEFLKRVYKAYWNNQTWRFGQTLFNVLASIDPQAAEEIRGTATDPFHARDSKDISINKFFTATNHLWD